MHPYNDRTRETPRQLSDRIVREALASQPLQKMRELEMSLAYQQATSLIEDNCGSVDQQKSLPVYFDLDDVDELAISVDEEAAYLDSRGLLDHHPDNPRWVSLRDESEPLTLSGGAVAFAQPGRHVAGSTVRAELPLPVQVELQAGMHDGLALGTKLIGAESFDLGKGESSARHTDSVLPAPVDAPVCTESEAAR